jgi:hypothetical protein
MADVLSRSPIDDAQKQYCHLLAQVLFVFLMIRLVPVSDWQCHSID